MQHSLALKRILVELKKERLSFDDLKESPPEGMDPNQAVSEAEHLLDQDVLGLDENLKLFIRELV